MTSYLAPIEKPKGLTIKLLYAAMRRQMGKVPTPFAVFAARMPPAFARFVGKISQLDKKLDLAPSTVLIVREHVARLNSCYFCMDFARWYALKESPDDVARIDALPEYQTSPLFSDAERAALDYATELTEQKHVELATFRRLEAYYSEREICDIVWVIASEHVYNMSNHGLNIGSDEFCTLRPAEQTPAAS
jgi:alkylhydroperoxidase family enzyme